LITRTVALLFILGAVASARAEEPLKVVTTIETFADLARRVGGEKVKVDSLSHGYQDPHFVEAKPSLMVVLHQADLLISVGMDLEVGWLPGLTLGARNEKIQNGQPGSLDCSTLIEPLDVPAAKVDRSQGDIHPMGNPHYWIPPVNAVRIAKGISNRLSQLRPADRAYFEARFAGFVTELKAKAPQWEAAAKPLAGTKVVTYHKSFSYVSRWLKLDEQGYIENRPGIPPSPDHLAKLIVMMRTNKVKLVMVEHFYNRAIADNVAEKAGAAVVSAPADVGADAKIKSYFDLVDALLAAISAGVATAK
jgi:zinc/manganese transport system substrate-binding protein